ncbi:MAG: outer membrane protein assembly factor BamD [Desulfuromonadales bacterium]|nr:outer membrane protein assembly factor BamD [Desulfuromonadales bacterium]
MTKLLSLLLTASLVLLAACASQTVVPPPKQASVYFQEGEEFFERGLYQDAIVSWEKVRDSYYSPELNALAELKIAEAYDLAEQYIEASVAYEQFLQNHPDSPRVAEVLHKLGLAYFKQMRAIDQDQTATLYALNAFRTLKQRYPEYRLREEVDTYLNRCINQLANHELYVGRFYLKNKNYQAAIRRFEGIFVRYPNYLDRDRTYYYLGQAYLKNGQRDQASEAFNTLFREFPVSEYIISAQKFVEANY